MEKAFDFLSRHRDVAFATVEADRPKIRVFQIMKLEGHTLYFATSLRKEVCRQIKAAYFLSLSDRIIQPSCFENGIP